MQKQGGFCSGLSIKEISTCKSENEILVCPFVFFRIKQIKTANNGVVIELEELPNKELIQQIMTPKKREEKEEKKGSQKESEKIQKPQIIEEKKQKALNFLTKKNQTIKKEIVKNEKEKIDIEIKYDKKIQEALVNLVDAYLKYPTSGIEEYFHRLDKKKQFFTNFPKFIEDLKTEFQLIVYNEKFFYDFIASKSTGFLPQKKSQNTEIQVISKENSNYLKQLLVEKVESKEILDFLFLILKRLFMTINQEIIICDELNENLLYNYCHRLTIGDLNNDLVKLVLRFKDSATKIKIETIIKSIEDFSKDGKYVKTMFSSVEILKYDESKYNLHILYLESNIKLKLLSDYLHEVFDGSKIEVLYCQNTERFTKFVFHPKLFDVRGNKDFILKNYKAENRGSMVYNFPNGYKRFGLLVDTQKDAGKWLTMFNEEGEWPVAFSSIHDFVIDQNIEGRKNDNPKTNTKYPFILKKGVQCVNDINRLEPLLDIINVGNIKFKVAFHCRVNPDFIQYNNADSQVYVLDRTKNDIIRPYGILIKQI